jgi:flagellar hook-basal body complex protein FliE
MPIDPSMAIQGVEWQVPGIDGQVPGGAGATDKVAGQEFGDMLSSQVNALQGLQTDAAQQSQALAAGEAADPSQVVMAVERARLGMQLASQIRTKLVEAQQDIFHTQV